MATHPFRRSPSGNQHAAGRVGRPRSVIDEPVERYDPSREDVLLLLGQAAPEMREQLEAAGWELRGDDGRRELWGRDRAAAARVALSRPSSAEPPGLDVA
jgi:hypothetical protein